MVESTLKTLIDRFRSRPEWQHPDPAVRAEAVLKLPASEGALLETIAREDADARVRRAAVKKLSALSTLAAIAGGDADASVREEAEARLSHLAVHEADEAAALSAVAALRDARQLGLVARFAPLAPVREAAVRALGDPRALSSIVREAEDLVTRLLALSRIEDEAALLALALKIEHKQLALAAVERISDDQALRTVAEKARAAAAARRAKARLAPSAEPAAPAAAQPPPRGAEQDEAERRAYEEARAAHEREAAVRTEALAARARLAEALEAAEGEAIAAVLESAHQQRAALAPLAGTESEALERRIDAALAAATARQAAFQAGAARRERLEALVSQAEQFADGEPAAARAGFGALDGAWRAEAAAELFPDLRARFHAAAEKLRTRDQAARAEQSQRDQQYLQQLVRLAERAETLVEKGAQAPLRDADQALREIREALEHPGHFSSRRDREQAVARLEAARKRLYPLVQQLREDNGWKRWANVTVQEELCQRAEALLEEPDAEKAASALRDLDARWRQAKEAPKEQAEALWTRFKAARDRVKARGDAFFARQAEELGENLGKKEGLCAQAEALAESTDWLKTAEELRALQAQWKAIGPVPRAASQRVWERFRKPCDRFFSRWQQHRSQRSHEWAENLKKKEALCEQAEALRESSDWDAAASELKRLQADWRQVGAVKKSRSDAVWQRFRAACDHFFDRYKNRDEHARQAARTARESICSELESMLPGDGVGDEPPGDLASRVQAAQTAWRQAGGLPQDEMAPLEERFARVRDALVEAFPRSFEGTELDPEASRRKAERLAARVEALVEELAPPAGSGAQTAEELALRLRDALASNTIGGPAALEAKWQSAASDVESAQLAWKRLGPLPGEAGRALAQRFEKACRRLAELRPRPERAPRGAARSRPEARSGRGPRPSR